MLNKGTKLPLSVIYIYLYPKLIYLLRSMKHMQSVISSLLGLWVGWWRCEELILPLKYQWCRATLQCPKKVVYNDISASFSYLKMYCNYRTILDISYPNINKAEFDKKAWLYLYRGTKQTKPPNIPKVSGDELIIRAYVDVAFAGEKVMRGSRKSFVIMLSNEHI